MLRYIIALASLLLHLGISAQATDNSVFSRFGIGDLVVPGYSSFSGMGGSASGYYTEYTLNNVNPASYSRLTTAVFDIGLGARNFETTIDDVTGPALWSGQLNNIGVAFPLRNTLNKTLDPLIKPTDFGMALGINALSRVGYNVSSINEIEGVGTIENNFQGFGGLNKFYWGSSMEYKNFSVGINANFIFGRLNYDRNVIFSDILTAYNNLFSTSYSAKGLGLDAGILYTYIFNEDELKQNVVGNKLTIGLHASTSSTLNTNADIENITFQSIGTVAATDTLFVEQDVAGEIKLPGSFGTGISYQKGLDWAISGSFNYTPWSNYTNDRNEETLNDVKSIQVGGWFTPNAKSYTSYFKRIRYKFGGFYRTEPSQLGNTEVAGEIDNYGLTMGVQLPFVSSRRLSRGDLSVTLGRKGNDLISEDYINLRFGFSFNDDQWFLKRKYN
jgi:hypothetical protein